MNSRRSFLLLVSMALITALVTLDTTITGVILPSVGRSLHADFSALEWVVTGYMLPFAALLLPAGAWADFWGRKRSTLLGLAIFGVASLACGLAPTAGWLIAARVLQGIGASFLAGSIAIIAHAFQGDARLRAFALLGTVIGIATVIGPMAGGLLASWVGWRWAFLVNPPLCALLAVATKALAEESKNPAVRRFDRLGGAVFAAALVLLTEALIAANSPRLVNPVVLGCLLLSGALFTAFAWIERRVASPMVDLALFTRPAFLGATTGMIGYAASAQILIFYVPLYLQNGFGYSAMAAGIRMAPYAVPLFLMPRVAARMARVYPARIVLGVGLALTFAGNLAMALVADLHAYGAFAAGMAVAGVGAGLLNGESAKAFFTGVPASQSGLASGLGMLARFCALLIAVAVIGAAIAHAGFAVAFGIQAAVAAAAAISTYRFLQGVEAEPVAQVAAVAFD